MALSTRARRVWPLVIVIIVVAAMLLYSRHQPVDVTADYVLTGQRKDLSELHVTWTGDDGKTIAVSYHFDEAAPRIQTQELELPPDTYTVILQLVRRNGTSERSKHRVVIEQEQQVELRPELAF